MAELAPWEGDVVGSLRKAGAVIMGKTVSTPYAWIDPPPTRNPWNFDRTPGGSSSGRPAAVATGMCLGRLGHRPAARSSDPAALPCGVAGLKPTCGCCGGSERERESLLSAHLSFDTPGPFALVASRRLRRLYLATDMSSRDPVTPPLPSPHRGSIFRAPFHDQPRIRNRLRGFFEDHADPEMTRAIDRRQPIEAPSSLARQGGSFPRRRSARSGFCRRPSSRIGSSWPPRPRSSIDGARQSLRFASPSDYPARI